MLGFASTPGDDSLLGGDLRLVRYLGSGGAGQVWEAEHTGLGCRVAVKRLHRELASDEVARQRFLREAGSASAVANAHVVEIFDISTDDDGVPYLVMELIDGEPLGAVIRRDRRLAWPRAAALLHQVASGLACAHAHGVIHRDLKPSNIIVRRTGTATESAKIIDFGLATRRAAPDGDLEITRTGEVLGSPGYMSPEQLRGACVDARADIYALGCIAFEMLTGRKPFSGPSVADLIAQHLTQRAPRVDAVGADPGCVPAISELVARALEKDPERRHPSIEVFVDELVRIGVPGRVDRSSARGGQRGTEICPPR